MKKFFVFSLFVVVIITLLFPARNFSRSNNYKQLFSLLPSNLANGEITTIVGSDRAFGDGGLASQASLNSPKAVIFDKKGNLLIADTNNHRVRKIDLSTGMITTIAGNGKAGFTGDAEPAVTASLNFPTGLALDERGNLFITDSGNNRIRRVDADSSVITTFAGNGNANEDKDNVVATETSLTNPFGLTIDKAGNLYMLQIESFRVRRIDANTKIISTFAGSGRPGVSMDGEQAKQANLIPIAIAMDNQDNLLIVDTNAEPRADNILISNRIRRVDSQTGVLSTVAGNACNPFRSLNCSFNDGDLATRTSLISPLSVTTDTNGNIFIADETKIKMVDATTGVIKTIAGNGTRVLRADNGDGRAAIDATIFPINLAVSQEGSLFVVDGGYDQIRQVDFSTGIINRIAGIGIGDGQLAKASKLVAPTGLNIDADGNLLIADTFHHLVRQVDSSTGIITTIAGTGRNGFNGEGKLALDTDLSEPIAVVTDVKGNVFILEKSNRVRRIDALTSVVTTVVGNGIAGFKGDTGSAINAQLNSPSSMVIDSVGNLFIADTLNQRIRKVDAQTKIITTIAGNGQIGFSGDGGQAVNASLNNPAGLALDSNNNLLIADDNNRIRSLNLQSGIITTIAGSGKIGFKGDGKLAKKASFQFPKSIVVDKDNNIFVADSANNRIRRIDGRSAIISTVAGNGIDLYTGDNGPALKAGLAMPTNIALDKQGNLFITDKKNNVVRVVKGN